MYVIAKHIPTKRELKRYLPDDDDDIIKIAKHIPTKRELKLNAVAVFEPKG